MVQKKESYEEKYGVVIVTCLLLVSMAFVHHSFRASNAFAGDRVETRRGWFHNPTPANISLYDRDGEWVIGVQSGHQVKNDWEWPGFKPRQWVRTNVGGYGYGCACLQMKANHQTHEVEEIKGVRTRPLAACRQDRSLKHWERSFQ